jgi:hypothetical protein
MHNSGLHMDVDVLIHARTFISVLAKFLAVFFVLLIVHSTTWLYFASTLTTLLTRSRMHMLVSRHQRPCVAALYR